MLKKIAAVALAFTLAATVFPAPEAFAAGKNGTSAAHAADGKTASAAAAAGGTTASAFSGLAEKTVADGDTKKDISTLADSCFTILNPTYTGGEVTPTVTIVDGAYTLKQGEDYYLNCTKNVLIGDNTANVTINGTGTKYKGSVTKSFSVLTDASKLATDITVVPIADQQYTGSQIWPEVHVYLKGIELTLNSQYTVASYQATNVGVGYATVHYNGKCVSLPFNIVVRQVNDASVCADIPAQAYNGQALEPQLTIKVAGRTLQKGTDFDPQYFNNTDVGTAIVQIAFRSNYSGSIMKTFRIANQVNEAIVNATIKSAKTLSDLDTIQYLDKTLKKGTDYDVATTVNSDKTTTCKVTFKGTYMGTASTTLPAATEEPTEPALEDVNIQPMYRLYNPNSGEHFYTADKDERKGLVARGWNYEGIGWYAPQTSTAPVYRLYNRNAGDHHYTLDYSEKEYLRTHGWIYEGVGWYSDEDRATPLYRQYNPNARKAGAHNFTTSKEENDTLVSRGWEEEGLGWYGVSQAKIELYRKHVEKGTQGFFESVNATDAVDIIKASVTAGYTDLADETDATSLDNMMKALDYIDEANALRKKEGKTELKVTDYMMAVAQAAVNEAAKTSAVPKAEGVGFNPLWGYARDDQDPFDYWYTKEKALYDAGTTDWGKTGHYQNLVKDDYAVTGFAVNQKGKYKATHGQTFYFDLGKQETFTVAEYRTRFLKYYEKYK